MAQMTSWAGCGAPPPGGARLHSTPRGIPDDVRGTPARAPRRPPHGIPERSPWAPPPASVAVSHVLPPPLAPSVVSPPRRQPNGRGAAIPARRRIRGGSRVADGLAGVAAGRGGGAGRRGERPRAGRPAKCQMFGNGRGGSRCRGPESRPSRVGAGRAASWPARLPRQCRRPRGRRAAVP